MPTTKHLPDQPIMKYVHPADYSTFQCDRPISHDADIRSHRRIYPNGHDYIELRAGQCQRNPL
jgi:hypothetical protein